MPFRPHASTRLRRAADVPAGLLLAEEARVPVDGPGGDSRFPADVSDEELAQALRVVSWNERDLRHFFLRRRGFQGGR